MSYSFSEGPCLKKTEGGRGRHLVPACGLHTSISNIRITICTHTSCHTQRPSRAKEGLERKECVWWEGKSVFQPRPLPCLCSCRFPLPPLPQAMVGSWLLDESGALSGLPAYLVSALAEVGHTVGGQGWTIIQPHRSLVRSSMAVSHCLTMML